MRLFITGGRGFVGRRLLACAAGRDVDVVALVRGPPASGDALPGAPDVVVGDLLDPQSWSAHLEGADAVVHLAAVTGKARAAAYRRVNVEGTRVLLEAAGAAGVPRFVFVSSVAAGFPDRTGYPYADSKLAAERLVLGAELEGLVVRPTIIVGPGAPVLAGLERMAGLFVMPVFGDGRARVQPVQVDDVAAALFDLARDGGGGEREIDVGGPDVVTIEDLLARVRRLRSGRHPRAIHLPLRLFRGMLRAVEGPLLAVLPLTAGQLATFANDGTARPSSFMERRAASLVPLDRALQESFDGDA